jgi:hypothetical protein
MSTRLSESAYAELTGNRSVTPKRSKYHAIPVVVTEGGEVYEAKAAKANGIKGQRFASKAEARRYLELKVMERTGQISELVCQPRFDIHALDGSKVAFYRADYRYYERATRRMVVEDVKGGKATATATYRLKKKLVEAEHGVTIREVRS